MRLGIQPTVPESTTLFRPLSPAIFHCTHTGAVEALVCEPLEL